MKSCRINILFFFIVISLFSELSFAQKYNFRNFSIKEGLPDAIVRSIVQTEEGFLYFATQKGLSKFDGKTSLNYNTNNGLPDNLIRNILQDENKLLLATFSGLSIFDGENFSNFSKKDGLTNDTLYTIFKDSNRFLIGTRNGISIFSNNNFLNNSEFQFFADKRVYSFEYGIDNSLFIGTNKGLFKVTNNDIVSIKKNISVFDLELSSSGTLWCGTNKGLFTYKNEALLRNKNIGDVIVYSIKEDKNKQIWFGTDNGIAKAHLDSFSFYTTTNDFQGKICYNIFQDKELNLWFATNHGVYLFDDGKFTLYDRRNGVRSTAWTIIEQSNGEIWAATDGNGVIKLADNKFIEIPYLSKLPKTIWSIFEDKNKNIWFCTSNGVSRLDSNNLLTHFSSKNGFTDDMILEISEDKNGYLWFSSFRSGIFKFSDNKFENISLTNAGSSPIYGAVTGLDNNLWFISASGIDRFNGKESLEFSNQDILNTYSFYSISVDRKNNLLLLGSYERGLIIYRPNAPPNESILKYISIKDGLSDNAILFTKFDNNNSILWIGTNKGLNRLNYKRFIETGEIIIKSFNEYDGYPSQECNQLGALIDSKGNFWFSSTIGIIKYDKTKEKDSTFTSSPFISSIEINYQNINLADFGKRNESKLLKYDDIVFPYDMNNLTIHFSALYFTNPLDAQFRYRLTGSYDDLSPLTFNKYVTFSSLSPGNYTFELISYTEGGTRQSDPIQFSFRIETPFWKSDYFVTTVIFLFFIIVYIIYRYRTFNIRRRNMQLLNLYRENVSYQKQLLESEKDYKGLFENAHSAILIIDPDSFLIIDANHSAELLYGYKRDELINLSTKVLSVDVKNTEELVQKVVLGTGIKKYKTAHLKKDGSEIILNVNASITNYKGKTAIISLQRDITEEEETKKQLLFAKEAAEKSNKLKSEFLAQISHEIRTPINTILGYSSLLSDLISENDGEEVQSLFPPIKRSSERIIRTIDLILNMSEVNAGTFDLSIKKIDVAELLYEIVIEQKQNARNKNLKLEFVNNATNSNLSIDYYTFGQIFTNLVDNAIKYTNDGYIEVILSNEDSKTIIEVKDTGIGISDEFLPTLFDSFTQEEQGYTRKYDGNGLGLALVKNYVKINKGTISVESKKGIGSKFRVEF